MMQVDQAQAVRYRSADDLLAAMREAGIDCHPPINLDVVVRFLGLNVVNDVTLEAQDIIGKIEFEGRQPVISINPRQNGYLPRRRFTLAHEIGHYCLHTSASGEGFTDSRRTMSRTATMWDTKEREANQFAADLLMPTKSVFEIGSKVLDENDDHGRPPMSVPEFTTRMADEFGVSNEAMSYRLRGLGILTK